MSNIKYDWDYISKCCAKLIAKKISRGEDAPSSFPKLYTLLQEECKREIPPLNTFRQVMHERLHVPNGKKNISSNLYQLAGRYDKMTLKHLIDNASISSEQISDNAVCLFIRIRKTDSKYSDRIKYLHYLSTELKIKFKEEIKFISFDTDTIVIFCANDNAKNSIHQYFAKSVIKHKVKFDKETENGN